MIPAKRLLRSRLLFLLVIGILAYFIDSWTVEHSQETLFILRISVWILIGFAIIADEFRGRLKASPIHQATIEEATSVQFVKVFIAIYLLLTTIAILFLVSNGHGFDPLEKGAFSIYLYLLPLVLVILAGKFIIEKEENP